MHHIASITRHRLHVVDAEERLCEEELSTSVAERSNVQRESEKAANSARIGESVAGHTYERWMFVPLQRTKRKSEQFTSLFTDVMVEGGVRCVEELRETASEVGDSTRIRRQVGVEWFVVRIDDDEIIRFRGRFQLNNRPDTLLNLLGCSTVSERPSKTASLRYKRFGSILARRRSGQRTGSSMTVANSLSDA